MHICYTYNGGALWWATNRILISLKSDTYDWLLLYTIYTKADLCAYIHTFTIAMTHKILLLLIKKIKCNVCLWICLILFYSMYVMLFVIAYTVYFLLMSIVMLTLFTIVAVLLLPVTG